MQGKIRYVPSVFITGTLLCTVSVAGCSSRVEPAADGEASQPASLQVPLSSGRVFVPRGKLVDPACVHEVPSGAHVGLDDTVTLRGGVIGHYSPCETPELEPPSGIGWVENTWENAPTSGYEISWLGNTWTVPSAPQTFESPLQTIYMFNSLLTSDQKEIIQPVLQWGPSHAGGGAYWIMASWLVNVNTGNYYFSTPINVSTGDTLVGLIYYVPVPTGGGWCQDSNYLIQSEDQTTGQSTTLGADSTPQYTSAQSAVLEGYFIKQCSDFPATGSTSFSAATVYEDPPTPWNVGGSCPYYNGQGNWTAQSRWSGNGFPNCGYSVSLGANGAATLFY